ncbi:glutathione S-transferase [Bosea sp. Root670]|uniref:glutathione S-transferase family protein n=1 Tax=Bosea sp. Root670 TaxID=1736583 RepID=UPI0007153566|nr:glutathione S-transferase family protein [Bosea sp. Root670]KRE00497.1 glutathione S-transferase [Bosea sp. Root670]
MADELVLYTNPMSRGRIARWMMEEVGQPYRAEIVGFGTPMKSADYKALNPMGKVPTLVHGDTVITECAAICAYMADAFPQAGLAPAPNSRSRGPYYRWMFFAAGPVEAAVASKAFGLEVPPDRARAIGYGTYADTMDTLEYAVTRGEYLTGDRFSAADVYVGSQVLWGLQFGTIEKRPAFEAYGARISARPAARRAAEIDDALMAEMQKQG